MMNDRREQADIYSRGTNIPRGLYSVKGETQDEATQAEREARRERVARIVNSSSLDMAVDWILILQDDIAELKQELAKAKSKGA